MLTELYIEALLTDEVLADKVWTLWNAGVITDDVAAWTWAILTFCGIGSLTMSDIQDNEHASQSSVNYPAIAAFLASVFFGLAVWMNPWNAIQDNTAQLLGQFIGYFFWGYLFAGINWLINRKKKTIYVSDFALKVAAVFLVLGGLVQFSRAYLDSPTQSLRSEAYSRCRQSYQAIEADTEISSSDISDVCDCYSSYWANGLSKEDLGRLLSGNVEASWAEGRTQEANSICGAGPLLLALTVQAANGDLPVTIEEGLRLDRLSSEGGNLNYHFNLYEFVSGEHELSEWIDIEQARAQMRTSVCGDPDTRSILTYDFDVVVQYSDMKGNLLFDIVVSEEDCN